MGGGMMLLLPLPREGGPPLPPPLPLRYWSWNRSSIRSESSWLGPRRYRGPLQWAYAEDDGRDDDGGELDRDLDDDAPPLPLRQQSVALRLP